MTQPLDLSPLSGKTGLILEHEISSDSERTRMRSVDEIIKLDNHLTGKSIGCNEGRKTRIMRNMFMFRGTPQNFRPTE